MTRERVRGGRERGGRGGEREGGKRGGEGEGEWAKRGGGEIERYRERER